MTRTPSLARWVLAARLARGSIASAMLAQKPALPPPGQTRSALQQMLLQNPGLGDSIRARLQSSGLTPDQIRARLEAGGYPANLLDAYLASRTPNQPTCAPVATALASIEAL